MIEEQILNRCGTCEYFTNKGEWDLCCSKPPARKTGCFGFLCFDTTPACENYKNTERINSFVRQVNSGVLPPMDYLGDLGLCLSGSKDER